MTARLHPPAASMPTAGSGHDGPGLCVVVGKHEPDGWKVSILRDGMAPIVLTTEAARTMSRDLNEMADICEGKWSE